MQAIIFDCDGTLADTMPIHFEAWTAALARHKFELDEDRFYALGGWPSEKIVALLAAEAQRTVDVMGITHEKESLYLKMLPGVRGIAPVTKVVAEHRGRLPMAVATGAMRAVCEETLAHIGLAGVFDTIVCCEDVTRHKPEPDVFLEAARRLGVPAQDCVVYEDSDPGIAAAKNAGMAFVDVRAFFTPRRITSPATRLSA